MDRTPETAIKAVAQRLGVTNDQLNAEPSKLCNNFWQVTDTNTGEIYLYGIRAGQVLPASTIRSR